MNYLAEVLAWSLYIPVKLACRNRYEVGRGTTLQSLNASINVIFKV